MSTSHEGPAEESGDPGARVEALQQALEALRETEERYRLAAQATDDVIWDWDFAHDEIRWNEAMTRRFGHAPDGMVTTIEWWEARLHPEDRGRVIEDVNAAISGPSPSWSGEYRFERADGSYAYVFDRGFIIRDAEGRGTRMVGAILDFTERKLAEQLLRESEEHYRYTVELSPQMPWTSDPDGRLLTISRSWLQWTGWAVESALGDGWFERIHPDDAQTVSSNIRECLSTGQPIDWQARVRRATGDYRWIRTRAYPRLAEDGRIIRWYGLTEDIHQQRTAEQQLQRLQDELLQVARVSAMGTLASALAHELNQPLAAITNYMAGSKQLLTNNGLAATDVVIEALDSAAKSAVQAGEIVRRLRRLVVQGEVKTQPVDLPALAQEARELTAGETRKRGAVLVFEFAPGTHHVLGDRIQIQQVLVNLIRNAAEAMETSPARTLRLHTQLAEGERVLVRVEDSGPGVPPEIKRHLFAPFVTSKENGMGVGLAICRSIVEAHGGEIWAEDLPTGSAAFCFTLARASADAQG